MLDYDFHILQPNEFERLVRDLLQKKEKIFIESFTSGRDGGIDLRYATCKDTCAIVQVKRYCLYSALKSELKREVEKIKKLNPSRYILATSIGLTPANKEEIIAICSPYITTTEDILGRDDLNNLLGIYPEVEKQYYKLWLGSISVLEQILDKRINTWSEIELYAISKEVSTYVMNDSFDDALAILKNNGYVIISGIPGIGKTTLARMLVNYLLAEGYEELVNLYSIDDAAQKFVKERKQIYFFDDFLGSNTLNVNERSFDKKLLAFIETVRRHDNKLFILSTREYILNDALNKYESLVLKNIGLSKCVLDISQYSESIRAEILYNHLSLANLPVDYIKQILFKKGYLQIVKHKNYSPRIIEAFLNKQSHFKVSPQKYMKEFVEAFDRPYAVWEGTFASLEKMAQYALFIRCSMGGEGVFMTDWIAAVKYFISNTNSSASLVWDEMLWRESVKVMEGTFVISQPYKDDLIVRFINPSVYDFLVTKLATLNDLQAQLIECSYFCDQLFSVFSEEDQSSQWGHHMIKLRDEHYPILEQAFFRHLSTLHVCRVTEYITFRRNREYYVERMSRIKFTLRMHSKFRSLFAKNKYLYTSVITQDLLIDRNYSLSDRMAILDVIPHDMDGEYDLELVATNVLEDVETVDDYVNIMSILHRTNVGANTLSDETFINKMNDTIESELESVTSFEECVSLSESVSVLCKELPKSGIEYWEPAISEMQAQYSDGTTEDVDFPDYKRTCIRQEDYEEMFTSLLCKY